MCIRDRSIGSALFYKAAAEASAKGDAEMAEQPARGVGDGRRRNGRESIFVPSPGDWMNVSPIAEPDRYLGDSPYSGGDSGGSEDDDNEAKQSEDDDNEDGWRNIGCLLPPLWCFGRVGSPGPCVSKEIPDYYKGVENQQGQS